MLVLTRRIRESLIIGDDIKITIIRLNNGSVSIGIEAPKDVNIVREEILRYKEKVNKKGEDHGKS